MCSERVEIIPNVWCYANKNEAKGAGRPLQVPGRVCCAMGRWTRRVAATGAERLRNTRQRLECERRRRLVAETWAEIAARQGQGAEGTQLKRKMEMLKTNAKEDGTEMTTAATTAAPKRPTQQERTGSGVGRRQAVVEKRSGARNAKSPKRKREDSQPDTQEAGAQAMDTTRSSEPQPPAQKEQRTTPTTKPYQYACPFCNASVGSTVRTGDVGHRQARGNRFAEREGKVAVKEYAYCCHGAKLLCQVMSKVDAWTIDGVVNRGAGIQQPR